MNDQTEPHNEYMKNSPIEVNFEDYRHHLAGSGLSVEEADIVLEALLNIIQHIFDLGFSIDNNGEPSP